MRIRIKDKIIVGILALILFCISTTGFFTYKNSKEILLTELKNSNMKTLQNANDFFLKKFFLDINQVLNHWSYSPEIKNYRILPEQSKTVTSIPNNFKPIWQQWNGYTYVNEDIMRMYLGLEYDGSIFSSPIDSDVPQSYDSRRRDWYSNAIMNDEMVVWSAPYQDAGSNERVITASKCVKSGDSLIGVIGMDLELEKLCSIINTIRIGNNGYLMLLSKNGDIYSHPNSKLLLSNVSNESWAKDILSKLSGTGFYTVNGEEKIISFLTIPDTQWKFVVVSSANLREQLLPIQKAVLQTAAISILITFILGYFLSFIIMRPVQHIMKGIEKISSGDFKTEIQVNSRDEFGTLAKKFNGMVKTIHALLEERDYHVKELKMKNKEAIAQNDEISALYEETEALNGELHQLINQVENNYLCTVKVLANSIEANDLYTRGHCDRVTKYALDMGKALNLNSFRLLNLEFASILHDIGKIGIPSQILNKESRLTNEEFDAIKTHPQIGFDILRDVDFLEDSRKILLQHHERVDGKGYPFGLKGDEIDILAKIIIIADSYDAMTSARSYRKVPLTEAQAIDQLLQGKGTQFDEALVDLFITLL